MARILQLLCFQCHALLHWETPGPLKYLLRHFHRYYGNLPILKMGRSWQASVLILNKRLFLCYYTLYFSSSCVSLYGAHLCLLGWERAEPVLLLACIFDIATAVTVFYWLVAPNWQLINILLLFISKAISFCFGIVCCLLGHVVPVKATPGCLHSWTQGTKGAERVNHGTTRNT